MGVVALLVGVLAAVAYRNSRAAIRARDLTNVAMAKESDQRKLADQRLFVAEMNLASQAVQSGNVLRARELLESQRQGDVQRDLRDFTWRYLWGRCQSDSLAAYRGHRGEVRVLAFSPDGSLLASAGDDMAIHIVAARTQALQRVLRGHIRPVTGLAFTPDGRALISAAGDGIFRWSLLTGRPTARIPNRADRMVLAPDGRRFATGAADGKVTLWDAVTMTRQAELIDPGAKMVNALAFSPDCSQIASGHIDHLTRVWDVTRRRLVRRLAGHKNWIFGAQYSPDGRLLVTVGGDSTIRVWDVRTGRQNSVIETRGGRPLSLSFAPDSVHVVTASASEDGVRLWHVVKGTEERRLIGIEGQPTVVAFSPRGN